MADASVYAAEVLRGYEGFNVFATLAHHPGLLRKFLPFGTKLLDGGTLAPRLRELAILRVAHRARCDYELAHHREMAAAAGLRQEEIAAASDSATVEWDAVSAAVISVVDQLDSDSTIDDALWANLRPLLSDKEIIELIMLCGCYRMLAGLLNALHVPLDDPPVTHA